MKKQLLRALFACGALPGFSQTAGDVVIPVTVTTTKDPVSIALQFPTVANATGTQIQRRRADQSTWTSLNLPADAVSFTDTAIVQGLGYEYKVTKTAGVAPASRYGLVFAGIDLPAPAQRGKAILVVDDGLLPALAPELDRFVLDLRADGWQVLRHDVSVAAQTVPGIKALIRADYLANPAAVKTAFLIGDIPVPYSGNINPDGHSEHRGAWPTDYYYSDMNETSWTDASVNTVTAARLANRNVPGDGKFDQSVRPTAPELVVSRLDFSNLSGWDVSQTELYRRYFDKNHAFRTGAYKPENKTLIDDNFHYFNGEAFAQNGWNNGYALTGPGSVVESDFFNGTEKQSYLVGYGCGGGNYMGADGVGISANFMTDTVHFVFSMLFGSYFGDWDYETNPFMPSALASKGGILTCAWAGRPNWTFHHMGLGLPIYASALYNWTNGTQLNPVYPTNFGGNMIHAGLLGDPTLRAHAVPPPSGVEVEQTCEGLMLGWKPSADTAVSGYAVFRAAASDGVFQPIAEVDSTRFTDKLPLTGVNHYFVKAIKLERTPTGTYFNHSLGAPAALEYAPLSGFPHPVPDISCPGGTTVLTLDSIRGGAGAPYAYDLDGGPLLDPSLPSTISGGFHAITYYDRLGCSISDTLYIFGGDVLDAVIAGSDTACMFLPEQYILQGSFNTVQWEPSGSGTIVQGQGTPTISVVWPNAGPQSLTAYVNYAADCLDTLAQAVFVDICLASAETALPGVQLYPNPFGSSLTLQFDRTPDAGARVSLFDLHGRLVSEQFVTGQRTRLETVDLPAGFYQLRVAERGRAGVWKVLKR